MMVDPVTLETATLFGNAAAVQAAQSVARGSARQVTYPAGAVLALVHWGQRQDPHWFGARIPDAPRAVEFIEVGSAGHPARYRKFAGAQMTEVAGDNSAAAKRIDYILNLPPAQLP